MATPNLLIVAHAPMASARRLLDALVEGTRLATAEVGDVEVVVRPALEATADDVLAADAVLLLTPCNFGYMSGALKHFFDSTYRRLEGRTDGLPYALVVKGTTDASGVARAVEPIATGMKWRRVRPPLVLEGDVEDHHVEAAIELGGTFAAGLATGAL